MKQSMWIRQRPRQAHKYVAHVLHCFERNSHDAERGMIDFCRFYATRKKRLGFYLNETTAHNPAQQWRLGKHGKSRGRVLANSETRAYIQFDSKLTVTTNWETIKIHSHIDILNSFFWNVLASYYDRNGRSGQLIDYTNLIFITVETFVFKMYRNIYSVKFCSMDSAKVSNFWNQKLYFCTI